MNNDFEKLFDVVPDHVLNLIYDVFKTNSLYNKSGTIMQSLKECGQASINLNAPICTFLNGKSELNFLIHEKSMKKEIFFEYVSIFSQQVKDVFHEINAIVFAGENNNFYRTQYSKKFVTAISSSPVLTKAKEKMKVVGIGDVLAYVNNECFDEVYTTKADELSLKLCLKELSKKTDEFLYVELGDLEKVYLDKGDLLGARKYLETFDERLGEMIETLSAEDTIILVSTSEKQNANLPFFVYRKNADNLEEFGKLLNHTYIFRELVENTWK